MLKIAIYGKGGSGKSTVSAALSVTYARRGKKVLLVGCDPKADSTLVLTGGRRIKTLLELLGQGLSRPDPAQFIVAGRLGIDCIEAGGPTPGAGCGGRGIARMFELFGEVDLFATRNYDLVIFDVLGDVVCGGFAAPLRHGFADRAFVVVSEEPLSLYAANNIIQAVEMYKANGVSLGGLIVNASDVGSTTDRVQRYASTIGARITGTVPRDPAIHIAETNHLSAAEVAGNPSIVKAFSDIADAISASFDSAGSVPQALDVDALFTVMGHSKASVEEEELDSAVEPGQASSSASASGVVVLEKRVGGFRARQALSHLLAFNRGSKKTLGIEVAGFAFEAGTYYFDLKSRSYGDLHVEMQPTAPDSDCFAVAGCWGVSYSGSLSGRNRPLLDYVVARIGKLDPPPEVLAKAIALVDKDVEDEPDSNLASDSGQSAGPIPRHWCIWGEAGQQGVFLFDEERTRLIRTLLRLGGARTFNVHHASDVCQFSKQKSTLYSSHFIRPPWHVEHPEHEYSEHSDWATTHLTDYDLIAGSNTSLEEILRVAGESGEVWDAVSVFISCSPVIAGEDWQGTVRRFSEAFDGPVLTSGIGDGDKSRDFLEVVREYLRKRGLEDVEPRQNAVHLVGFPPTRVYKELVELLNHIGLTVIQRQLPVLQVGGLRRYGEAAAQLQWPIAEYQTLYGELFSTFGVSAVTVPPPYGISGVRAFLESAVQSVGMELSAVDDSINTVLRDTETELDQLRPRTALHRVGIALTTRQVDLLDHPERLAGIPIAGFLEELGFQVELLHTSEDDSRLNWWLNSGLSAVCTDVSHDRRLLERGIGCFGIPDLEAGLPGAVRSAERLLAICETPFFGNYSTYAGLGRGKS
jgi:nitrogenase iron protein NifH